MEHCDVLQQLSATAHALNDEYAWGRSPETLQSYAEAVSEYCTTAGKLEAKGLRQLLINYHQDHDVVAALYNRQHTRHLAAWQKLQSEIGSTLAQLHYTRRLQLTPDSIEDLIQEASKDIWRGIEQFRYDSRLSTWLYHVVANCAWRSCRPGRAKRRGCGAISDSLDALKEVGSPRLEAPQHPRPEECALNDDLRRIIALTLGAAADTRLRAIFELKEYEGYTIREIGCKLHLSPARVSNLLQQAKQILSANPAVRTWFHEELAL